MGLISRVSSRTYSCKMKRQNQDNESPPKRIRPTKKFTGRMLVAADQGGYLIGRGGSTIQAIRKAYPECKVDCPDIQSNGDFRVVHVDSVDITKLEQSMRNKRITLKSGWNAVNILMADIHAQH